MKTIRYTMMETPLGSLLLARSGAGLCCVSMQQSAEARQPQASWVRDDAALRDAAGQFESYFAGELKVFDLELDLVGTEFQKRVWKALTEIPYGTTASYRDVAVSIGRPTAARAVGAANRSNKLAIIVPCHRVVAADGSLGGYYGGLHFKTALLSLESPSTQLWGDEPILEMKATIAD